MNVLRSPDKAVGRAGSTPDLSRTKENMDTHITLRSKRKQCDRDDEVKAEILDFREEIMSFLTELDKRQDDKMNSLHADMTKVIREEVSSLKISIAELSQEQQDMKLEMTSIKEMQHVQDVKIKSLESGLQEIKHETTTSKSTHLVCEDIATELYDRAQREKNIIIFGLKEPMSSILSDRISEEKYITIQILKKIYPDCAEPVKIMRLGKYDPEKRRPLKVCFETSFTCKQLLRNKNKAQDVKIYADQTPQQQNYLKELKGLLQKRQSEGETDIGIKYYNGVPKIVKLRSKNSVSNTTLKPT